MEETSIEALRIGDWSVHPDLSRICRGEEVQKLDPQNMKVLQLLASRPGHVFSQRTIEEAVWTDVIVTPNSVYQSIAQLRKALGDGKSNPQYIETIPRKGYRLLAPVSRERPDNTATPAANPIEPTAQQHGLTSRHRLGAIATAAGVLAIAVGVTLVVRLGGTQVDTVDVGDSAYSGVASASSQVRLERLVGLATEEYVNGNLDRSISYLKAALADPAVVMDGDGTKTRLLANLAHAYYWKNDPLQAEQAGHMALSSLAPDTPPLHPARVQALMVLADVLLDAGKYEEAELFASEAIMRTRELYGDSHMRSLTTEHTIVELLLARGKLVEAEQKCRDLLTRFERYRRGEIIEITSVQASLIVILNTLGKFDEAHSLALASLNTLKESGQTSHPYYLSAQHLASESLLGMRRLKDAEQMARDSLAGHTQLNAHPWRVARSLSTLAAILTAQGKLAEASQLFARASALFGEPAGVLHERALVAHRKRLQQFETARTEHLASMRVAQR